MVSLCISGLSASALILVFKRRRLSEWYSMKSLEVPWTTLINNSCPSPKGEGNFCYDDIMHVRGSWNETDLKVSSLTSIFHETKEASKGGKQPQFYPGILCMDHNRNKHCMIPLGVHVSVFHCYEETPLLKELKKKTFNLGLTVSESESWPSWPKPWSQLHDSKQLSEPWTHWQLVWLPETQPQLHKLEEKIGRQ